MLGRRSLDHRGIQALVGELLCTVTLSSTTTESMKPRDVKPLQKLAKASASCSKEVRESHRRASEHG